MNMGSILEAELCIEMKCDLNDTEHDYRRTSGLMRHHAFQTTRDRVY
jgi:hypothetical protein